MFEKKKQELDAQEAAEEEVQKKLNGLKIDNLFEEFFDEMGWSAPIIKREKKKRLFHFDQLDLETGKLKSDLGSVNVEKEMQKSVLKPGIEQEHRLPKYMISARKLKAINRVIIQILNLFLFFFTSLLLIISIC